MGGRLLTGGGDAVAGLCGRCGRRPPGWGDVLCTPCGTTVRRLLLWRSRAAAAGRWAGACLLDGLVGVGAGALALWPATAAGGPIALAGALAVAALLAWLLALTVFLAGCWLMRPFVARWGAWAAVDGAELLAGWLAVTVAVLAAGYAPGMLAATGFVTGCLAAMAQGRVLAAQTIRSTLWAAGSALVWLVAGGVGFAVELALPGTTLGVIAGAGLGRLLHGALAGPLLTWALMPGARR